MLWGPQGLKNKTAFLAIASSVALADFISKKMIESFVHPHEVIPVLPFLNIVNVRNTGAAFGILSTLSNKVFVAVSFLAILFILLYFSKTSKTLERISLSLVLGGAAGNLIDRLRIGQVIDFIDFYVGNWHWPAFNVADSALTAGVALFLLSNLFFQKG